MIFDLFSFEFLNSITLRAGIAFVLSFVLSFISLKLFIKYVKNGFMQSQPIYELAPSSHRKKEGTPTMGGVFFILSAVISTFLFGDVSNNYVLIGLITLILFCYIGIIDDLGKLKGNKNSSGLSSKRKMLYLFIASSFIVFLLSSIYHDSLIYVPFFKDLTVDLGVGVLLFWVLIFLATSNAVNLTDGLDGLATVPSIFSLMSFGIIIYLVGNTVFSSHLNLPFIASLGEVTVLISALIGGLIGFLWFNSHPAQIFMGDSGSLTLGGFLAYLAIISKSELLLLIIGFVFVMEALSVIIQVASFKSRGKRVFLMAPIHHHFEQKGWGETKIIVRFWIISFLTNIFALFLLKLNFF